MHEAASFAAVPWRTCHHLHLLCTMYSFTSSYSRSLDLDCSLNLADQRWKESALPRHDYAAKRSSKFEAREEQGRAPGPLRPASQPASQPTAPPCVQRPAQESRRPIPPSAREKCVQDRLDPGVLEFRGLRITQYGEVVETKTALRRSLPIVCIMYSTIKIIHTLRPSKPLNLWL